MTKFRIGVLAAAAVALYLRIPTNFTMPQFWAEDGLVFWKQALDGGWGSLTLAAAGYFVTLQRAVALAVSYLPPALAPAIYNYFAISFTLLAVWLATSPRLELPFKPLIALAIVVMPGGYEVLGSMGNTQWIVPIVAMLLLLMRPSTWWVTVIEALLCALFSVTGPFVVFLVPLGAALAYAAEPADRNRLIWLTAAMVPGLVASVYFMAAHPDLSLIPYGVPYETSSAAFWVALPLRKFMSMFHIPVGIASSHVVVGAVLGAIAVAIVAAACWLGEYRKQKLAMLFLGAAVMVSGMVKYRGYLPPLLDPSTTRYFYAANVFLIWTLCCMIPARLGRQASIGALVAIELFSVYLTFDTPRIHEDFHWRQWAAQMPSDHTLQIPIAPKGWFIPIAARD